MSEEEEIVEITPPRASTESSVQSSIVCFPFSLVSRALLSLLQSSARLLEILIGPSRTPQTPTPEPQSDARQSRSPSHDSGRYRTAPCSSPLSGRGNISRAHSRSNSPSPFRLRPFSSARFSRHGPPSRDGSPSSHYSGTQTQTQTPRSESPPFVPSSSLSPVPSRKEADSVEPRNVQQASGRKLVNEGDFEPLERAVIRSAADFHRVQVATVYAFPGLDTKRSKKLVNEAWDYSCKKHEVSMRLTNDIYNLVRLIFSFPSELRRF